MKNRYGIFIHQNTIISANSQLLLPELLCAPRGRQAVMTLLLQNLPFDFVDQVLKIAFFGVLSFSFPRLDRRVDTKWKTRYKD